MSTNEKINLVRILGRNEKDKTCKECIIPQELISAQGYYEGQTKLWLPKALVHNQQISRSLKQGKPHHSNRIMQWRLEEAAINKIRSGKAAMSQNLPSGQRWVTKSTKPTHLHQAIAVQLEKKWVPKQQFVARGKSNLDEKRYIPKEPSTMVNYQAPSSQSQHTQARNSFNDQIKDAVL